MDLDMVCPEPKHYINSVNWTSLILCLVVRKALWTQVNQTLINCGRKINIYISYNVASAPDIQRTMRDASIHGMLPLEGEA